MTPVASVQAATRQNSELDTVCRILTDRDSEFRSFTEL